MAFLLPWHSTTKNEVGPGDTEDGRRKVETRGFFSFIVFLVESHFAAYDRFAYVTTTKKKSRDQQRLRLFLF